MKKIKTKVVAIFDGNEIRRQWDGEKELWYFSVIDVIKILTGSMIPKRYWSDLKISLALKEVKCTIKSYG